MTTAKRVGVLYNFGESVLTTAKRVQWISIAFENSVIRSARVMRVTQHYLASEIIDTILLDILYTTILYTILLYTILLGSLVPRPFLYGWGERGKEGSGE